MNYKKFQNAVYLIDDPLHVMVLLVPPCYEKCSRWNPSGGDDASGEDARQDHSQRGDVLRELVPAAQRHVSRDSLHAHVVSV